MCFQRTLGNGQLESDYPTDVNVLSSAIGENVSKTGKASEPIRTFLLHTQNVDWCRPTPPWQQGGKAAAAHSFLCSAPRAVVNVLQPCARLMQTQRRHELGYHHY